jgi:hypothetical protein
MTNHKDFSARSGRGTWRLTGRFIHSLLIGGFALVVYLVLPLVDGPQFAQSASTQAAAYAPAVGYAVDQSPERRLAEEHQTYTDWLRAAHADAALHGLDARLPDQF